MHFAASGMLILKGVSPCAGRKLLQQFGQWGGDNDDYHRFNHDSDNEGSAAAAASAAASSGASPASA
jgi:hypothetical protein